MGPSQMPNAKCQLLRACSYFFFTLRPIPVHKIPPAHPLLAFDLQLVNVQRGSVGEAEQQAIAFDGKVSRSNDGDLRCRDGRVHVQHLAAKLRERAWPWLKTA